MAPKSLIDVQMAVKIIAYDLDYFPNLQTIHTSSELAPNLKPVLHIYLNSKRTRSWTGKLVRKHHQQFAGLEPRTINARSRGGIILTNKTN